MERERKFSINLLVLVSFVLISMLGTCIRGWAATRMFGDFNGDGCADLAIGAPNEDCGKGSVHVIYGSRTGGLSLEDAEVWTQDRFGVVGDAESFDRFGSALATGDFDNDGFDDLAVGVPGETKDDNPNLIIDNAGAVNIIYGSETGLFAGHRVVNWGGWWYVIYVSAPIFYSESPDYLGHFGQVLETGNFNNDEFDDLVVGEPYCNESQGSVHILYGSYRSNFGSTRRVLEERLGWRGKYRYDFFSSYRYINYSPSEGDNFGSALAVGDFGGDGYDDLAIGVPGANVDITYPGFTQSAGFVRIFYGSDNGLSGTDELHQGKVDYYDPYSDNIEGIMQNGGRFGMSLAAGDFNGDGSSDLAVGAPYVLSCVGCIPHRGEEGEVYVIYGKAPGSQGFTMEGNQLWKEGFDGIPGEGETDDHFGFSLAAGNFDKDMYDDLAISIPNDRVGSIEKAGSVVVIYGYGTGLNTQGSGYGGISYYSDRHCGVQKWHQDIPGIEENAEEGDAFGYDLAVGDFNGDLVSDLAVGVPGESVGEATNAGAVNVIYGEDYYVQCFGYGYWTRYCYITFGLMSKDSQLLNQELLGLDDAEWDDFFGVLHVMNMYTCSL